MLYFDVIEYGNRPIVISQNMSFASINLVRANNFKNPYKFSKNYELNSIS